MSAREQWRERSTASLSRIRVPERARWWRGSATTVEAGLLGVADALALLMAFAVVWLASGRDIGNPEWCLLAGAWVVMGALFFRLYSPCDDSLSRQAVDDFPGIVHWVVAGLALTAVLAEPMGPWVVCLLGVVALPSVVLMRGAARRLARRWCPPQRILLVGDEDLYETLSRKVALERALHVEIVAQQRGSTLERAADSGDGLDHWLGGLVEEYRCDRVVVGSESMASGHQLRGVIAACRAAQVSVSVLPTLCGAVGSRARLNHLAELPLLEFRCRPVSRGARLVKRALDLGLASLLLLASAPLMIAIAAAIRLEGGGSVFFRQQRGGYGGRPFAMFKFRTMVHGAEERLAEVVDIAALVEPMYKLERDPRLTRVGGFLRRTSLDELPQLVNVLRGEMSMVGPRPEAVDLVDRYDAEALAIRCGMPPGITGPMQVHGRGDLTFRERLAVEREYLENYSLSKDLRILMLTVSVLTSRQGAY